MSAGNCKTLFLFCYFSECFRPFYSSVMILFYIDKFAHLLWHSRCVDNERLLLFFWYKGDIIGIMYRDALFFEFFCEFETFFRYYFCRLFFCESYNIFLKGASLLIICDKFFHTAYKILFGIGILYH